jgi:predicted glycosyltransferase
MSRPGSILVYVQHLLGVGHVKRAAAIARALVAAGLDVHVVLGGEPVPLADFGRATLHQLPAARAADMSFAVLLDAHGHPVDDAWRAKRKTQLLAIEAAVQPAVILTEHFPFGRAKFAAELIPLFAQARARGPVKILASVRDVLVDKPDAVKTARMLGWLDTWFDGVLVHGDAGVIPFAATFSPAREIAGKLVYTGYVVDDPVPRAAASLDGTNEIIVSVGGGAVGEMLLRVAIQASDQLISHRWRLLAGANLPGPVFAALQAEARAHPHVIVERARPDFRQLLERAALSVSQGGYNTLMDVLVARCPAIIVPFAGGAESEQAFRAAEFSKRGLITTIDEVILTAPGLAATAALVLQQPRAATAPPVNLDGAANAARHIAVLCGLL